MKIVIPLLFLFLSTATFAQQFPDRHSTNMKDSWTSCLVSENPNKVRGDSHWIMYDFGNEYTLHGTTLWNVNGYNQTDKGTQELVIDYSLNGEDWTELASHTMEQASASSFYEGELGPDFEGLNARYVLITALSNYGHATCYGLSEVRFQASIASTTNVEEEQLADNNIQVSPNPFDNQTTITITDIKTGLYDYTVLDIAGKQVSRGSVNISSNITTIPLSMGNQTPGTYIFSLQYGALTLSKTLQLIR